MSLKDHDLGARSGPPAVSTSRDLMQLVIHADEKMQLRVYSILQAQLNLNIQDVNLSEALVVQHKQAQLFLDEVLHDDSIPANQRAQALGQANATIQNIIKQKETVMSQDRLRRFEIAFQKVIAKCATPEQKEAWMDLYGEYLKGN
jgi:hypothetical protein